MENYDNNILDHEESDKVRKSFFSHYLKTPFTFLGVLLSLFGLFIMINDIIKPSKMSPMGVYIGIAIILFGLFLILVSYLCYRFIPKQKSKIFFIQLTIVILIVLWFLKLFGMGISNLLPG